MTDTGGKSNGLTIEQARAKLDEIEKEIKGERE